MTDDTRGMNRRIKDAIVSILSGLQYNSENAFVAVLDNTHNAFDGSPVARVLPSSFTSVTGTNVERVHTVSYAVIVSWTLEDPRDVEADLYNQMYDLTDLIVYTFEHDDYIGQLSTIDPTIQNWMMNADRATWRIGAGKNGALLLCEVIISVKYSQDIY